MLLLQVLNCHIARHPQWFTWNAWSQNSSYTSTISPCVIKQITSSLFRFEELPENTFAQVRQFLSLVRELPNPTSSISSQIKRFRCKGQRVEPCRKFVNRLSFSLAVNHITSNTYSARLKLLQAQALTPSQYPLSKFVIVYIFALINAKLWCPVTMCFRKYRHD